MTKKRLHNKEKILELLAAGDVLTVEQAVTGLGVSEATVRRLFAELEAERRLLRFHGGVRAFPAPENPYSFGREQQLRVREKESIGRRAAALVGSGERIFLDSGTTTRACGNALAQRLRQREITDLVTITTSLAYTETLAQFCPVLLTGGQIRPERFDLAGPGVLGQLENYHFTTAILGTDGIAESGALTATDADTARIAQTVIRNADRVLILADRSKIGRPSFVTYAEFDPAKMILLSDE